MKPVPKSLRNNKAMPEVEDKKHYFLASGVVVFTVNSAEAAEEVNSAQVNGVFTTASGMVPVSGLANAQRVLQQQVADRAAKQGLPIAQILDVQITAISTLGYMAPSEFHDLDDGEQSATEIEAQ